MKVIKRDGNLEEFNVDKIIVSVETACKSCSEKMPQQLYYMLGALFGTLDGDTIGSEEIEKRVEDLHINDKHLDETKSYIVYKEKNKKIIEMAVLKFKFI